jgi:hypothetical protein
MVVMGYWAGCIIGVVTLEKAVGRGGVGIDIDIDYLAR